MSLCAIADVRAAGAPAPALDAAVTQAIADATTIVNDHTGDRFETVTLTNVVAIIGHAGVAVLPHRVQSVTSVIPQGGTAAVDSGAYILHSSANDGDYDGLEFRRYGYNLLVVGAEPWNEGYAGLFRPGTRMLVAGSFGWTAVPYRVKTACSLIAAEMLAHPPSVLTNTGEGPPDGIVELEVGKGGTSGYRVKYSDEASAMRRDTTGVAEADRLLFPYVRRALARSR